MQYWLIKSEPETWSWQQQKEKNGAEPWDGVRNYGANNHMKSMQVGDKVLFYHSGKEKQIMGIVTVHRTFYEDAHAKPFGFVDFIYDSAFKNPVTLVWVKTQEALKDMVLVKNSRLSVQPVTPMAFEMIVNKGMEKE